MKIVTDHPSTLVGIKRLAKHRKRDLHISHTEALDVAASLAGYSNYRHARNQLANLAPLKAASAGQRSPIWITAYWRDKHGETGRETVKISARQEWGSLLRPKDLSSARGLGRFRADAADHLESRRDLADQHAARRAVCEAARTLQFMEATGLRPLTRQVSRLAEEGRSMPRRDHASYWCHPETQALVAVDEPYAAPETILPLRQTWALQTGAAVAATKWDGMYFPENATLYFTSHDGRESELRGFVERLDREPIPVSAEDWTGESAPYSPLFLSPARAQVGRAKRGRPTAKYVGMVRRNAVVYGQVLLGGCWRPNAKMPIVAHKEVGDLLKELLENGGLRSRAYWRVENIRSELDEWVQREYRTQEELSSEKFNRLYYNDWTPSQLLPSARIDRIEALLRKHYPDSVPLRGLLRCLVAARKDLAR